MTALTPVTRLCRTRPVSGIWTHLQAVGLEPLLAEMREKTRLLECLLNGYNDGRHKACSGRPAYLLPLPELRAVLEQLGE